MRADETFTVQGYDQETVREALDMEVAYDEFAPVGDGFELVAANEHQQQLYEALDDANCIGGVVEGSGSQELQHRTGERTYVLELDDPVEAEVMYGDEPWETEVDTVFVKEWAPGDTGLAEREYEKLAAVDEDQVQQPTTIAVALVEDDSLVRQGRYLVKAREPLVTFNDLPRLPGTTDDVDELLREGVANWGRLAADDHYQEDILALDHQPDEQWYHDFGQGGRVSPGAISGGVEEPSNLGVLRVNGEDHCIVRDLEHVKTREELHSEPLPHERDRGLGQMVGDRLTSKLGRTLTSLSFMGLNVATAEGMDRYEAQQALSDALQDGYEQLYGRDHQGEVDVSSTAVNEVLRYRRTGSVTPDPDTGLPSVSDEVLAPEYMRIGLEIIDETLEEADRTRLGSLLDRGRERLRGVDHERDLDGWEDALDGMVAGTEQDWATTDAAMDELVELSGYFEPDDAEVPLDAVEPIVAATADAARDDPDEAYELVTAVRDNPDDREQLLGS